LEGCCCECESKEKLIKIRDGRIFCQSCIENPSMPDIHTLTGLKKAKSKMAKE